MIAGQKIRLRNKKIADARDDYTWQRDPELAHLDAVPSLRLTFPEYLAAYTFELHFTVSARRQFAIDTLDGEHIGNCVYYGIDGVKGEAELGIMIGKREYWGKGYGTDAVATLLCYIFRQTELERIYLKTLESNRRAQQCFRKSGFTRCGRMSKDGYKFVLMEITRERWGELHRSPETEAWLENK